MRKRKLKRNLSTASNRAWWREVQRIAKQARKLRIKNDIPKKENCTARLYEDKPSKPEFVACEKEKGHKGWHRGSYINDYGRSVSLCW